jgi:hypothetical protein
MMGTESRGAWNAKAKREPVPGAPAAQRRALLGIR